MFTLKINTDNAAFDEGETFLEVSRILKQLSEDIFNGGTHGGVVYDVNGNAVGAWKNTKGGK